MNFSQDELAFLRIIAGSLIIGEPSVPYFRTGGNVSAASRANKHVVISSMTNSRHLMTEQYETDYHRLYPHSRHGTITPLQPIMNLVKSKISQETENVDKNLISLNHFWFSEYELYSLRKALFSVKEILRILNLVDDVNWWKIASSIQNHKSFLNDDLMPHLMGRAEISYDKISTESKISFLKVIGGWTFRHEKRDYTISAYESGGTDLTIVLGLPGTDSPIRNGDGWITLHEGAQHGMTIRFTSLLSIIRERLRKSKEMTNFYQIDTRHTTRFYLAYSDILRWLNADKNFDLMKNKGWALKMAHALHESSEKLLNEYTFLR